jgi:hypothetical protein
VVLDVSLIPLLGRANTSVSKVTRLGRLAVGLDGATLVERDLAVVACATGSRAVCDFCAGELALYVCGVNAGFGGCESRLVKGSRREFKREHTGETNAVALGSALAVEVLLSLLGDLVDVGVLVFGRHCDVCCLEKFELCV